MATKKALCNLGASINLMPFSIFKNLSFGKAQPTKMTFQMVDKSIISPHDIIENAFAKIDKFIFLVDFVILDMNVDYEVLITIGRPFFATGKGLTNVQNGSLALRINDEEVQYNILSFMKFLDNMDFCDRIDLVDECVESIFQSN